MNPAYGANGHSTDCSTLTTAELGREGEELAAGYLLAVGYRVLDRNWRWRGSDVRGELDIVALAGDVLVVFEVKTRRTLTMGRPVDAVPPAKRERLWKLGNRWLAEHRNDEQFRRWCPGAVRDIRVDILGLLYPQHGGEPRLDHLQGV
jgi:putative endonuclease